MNAKILSTKLKQEKLKIKEIPIRIPESLRAIGTEGFKISSLNQNQPELACEDCKTNLQNNMLRMNITRF